MGENEKKRPLKQFKAGGVEVAVWDNEKGKSISMQRTYKDKNEDWKHTSSLNPSDIPKAVLALNKAYEYLTMKLEELPKE